MKDLSLYQPRIYARSVFTIDYDALYREGIRGLVFDIDNTLLPFYVPHATAELKSLFGRLKEKGFILYLLSNGPKERTSIVARDLDVPGEGRVMKPFLFGVHRVQKETGLPLSVIAMIGDQVFRDVLCANRCGAFSILTVPIDTDREEKTVHMRRPSEKKVLSALGLKAPQDSYIVTGPFRTMKED